MQKAPQQTTQVMPSDQVADLLNRPKIRIDVVDGPDAGRYSVGNEVTLQVGSQDGTSLQLTDETVSRIHLELTSTAEGIRVRDLGSTNGTWVEGRVRLDQATIPSGTILHLGHSRIKVQLLGETVSERVSNVPAFGEMIGVSEPMRAIFALMRQVAPTDETVLITGETGTGKELCAQSIVEASPRAQKPFVTVDCGALPPTLLENELFGHVRGAFTGAVESYPGCFERANGGTLFLDELGELPLALQSRLLRAVEQRTIRRIGDTREMPLNLRIIAATNRCLEEEVNRGTFRADLFYRLSVVRIRIPPLRDRPEDILPLAEHLLATMSDKPPNMDPAVANELSRHRWPGNVRELANYLRRMTVAGTVPPPEQSVRPQSDTHPSITAIGGAIQPFTEAKRLAVEAFEKQYLRELIQMTKGNVSEAARVAHTDRAHLTRLLKKYQISRH